MGEENDEDKNFYLRNFLHPLWREVKYMLYNIRLDQVESNVLRNQVSFAFGTEEMTKHSIPHYKIYVKFAENQRNC